MHEPACLVLPPYITPPDIVQLQGRFRLPIHSSMFFQAIGAALFDGLVCMHLHIYDSSPILLISIR